MAYGDLPIPLGEGQHMLRPSVAGRLLQAVDVQPGERVLEGGTGSGFLSACFARQGGRVHDVRDGAGVQHLPVRELRRKLEPVSTLVLLPVFFAFSGQNTRLAHVSEPGVLGLALLLLAVACLGKFGACWAAARATGTDQRLALALGALMNARGLMGLILLNTGLQRGLIQPPLFALLVLMVVVTTLLAAPLFGWFYGRPKP